MATVDAQHVLEMSATEDQDPIETVGTQCPDPAFGVGVCVRGLDRRPNHLDPLGAEDAIEGMAEFLVAIVDHESERLVLAELHEEVARLLRDPRPMRARGAGDVLDPSSRKRNEKQYVDPLQEGCLDGGEVAGERARRLLPQESPPR